MTDTAKRTTMPPAKFAFDKNDLEFPPADDDFSEGAILTWDFDELGSDDILLLYVHEARGDNPTANRDVDVEDWQMTSSPLSSLSSSATKTANGGATFILGLIVVTAMARKIL